MSISPILAITSFLKAYKNLGFKIEDYPKAFGMYENEISLPLHNFLSEDDVRYICDELGKLV